MHVFTYVLEYIRIGRCIRIHICGYKYLCIFLCIYLLSICISYHPITRTVAKMEYETESNSILSYSLSNYYSNVERSREENG